MIDSRLLADRGSDHVYAYVKKNDEICVLVNVDGSDPFSMSACSPAKLVANDSITLHVPGDSPKFVAFVPDDVASATVKDSTGAPEVVRPANNVLVLRGDTASVQVETVDHALRSLVVPQAPPAK